MADLNQTMDAIQAAIARSSNLAVDHVIWSFQNAPGPSLDYIALSLSPLTTVGLDYVQTTTDLTRPQGQEIEQRVRGTREVGLQLQAFTRNTADKTSAQFLAERTKTGLLLPSVRALLAQVEVSPFDPGPTNYVPDVVAVGFRGRATCTIRCYMPAPFVAEYVGYIAKINGTVTITGGQNPTPTSRTFSAP